MIEEIKLKPSQIIMPKTKEEFKILQKVFCTGLLGKIFFRNIANLK